jgi:6-pyruvoyltetrahydropterin/6-carboxytetrahydropterin synthase
MAQPGAAAPAAPAADPAGTPRRRRAAVMPFELRKSFAFEASHVLTGHDGKCARLHGHSYVLTLVLRGPRLHPAGARRNMLADFCDISAAAKGVVASHLDHHHLNDTLKTDSPTAEFIARWVYRALAPALGPRLAEVELRETATAAVVYRPSRATVRRCAEAWRAAGGAEELEAGGSEASWSGSEGEGGDGDEGAERVARKGANGCRYPSATTAPAVAALPNGEPPSSSRIPSAGP